MSGFGSGSPGGNSYNILRSEINKLKEDYDRLVRDTSTIRHEHSHMRFEIQIKDQRIKELKDEVSELKKGKLSCLETSIVEK